MYLDNVRIVRETFGVLPEVFERGAAGAVEVRAARSGAPALVAGGRLVHSARDPAREAARLVAAARAAAGGGAGPEAFVILGFGLGYAAREAARAASGSLILIVERRPEVFRAALETSDWTAFFTRHRTILMLDAEAGAVFAALKAAEEAAGGAARFVLLKNRALCDYDYDWYAAVEENIAVWRRQRAVNAATQKRFGARWTRNLAANRAALRVFPGVKRLAGGLAGADGARFTALLLAAGPSLDALLPYMEDFRQRFVVVAVDTALRFTRRAGVAPDFVVACDPQYWNSRHLDGCLAYERAAFIFESAVYPPLVRPFVSAKRRRVFWCASGAPECAAAEAGAERDGGGKGKLAAGGSVATSAWDFCRLLTGGADGAGPAELWVAGLDLAFPAQKTHYKGAFFEERALSAGGRLLPACHAAFEALHALPLFDAPAAGGGTVKTDARLSLYAAWFADAFARHAATRHYGLGGGGLAIRGLEAVPPEQALAKPRVRPALDAALERLYRQCAPDVRP